MTAIRSALFAGNTLTVTKTADTNDGTCDADCSLREAVAAANAGDTITFDTAGVFATPQTISLNGQIQIDKDLTINGTGANRLTVRNIAAVSETSRVFYIPNVATVTLSGMTISGGNLTGGSFIPLCGADVACGGGIFSAGNLTISDSVITGNTADSGEVSAGGGVYFIGGIMRITNSTFYGNSVTGSSPRGGAIYNAGTAFITNSTISGNLASGGSSAQGGGIYQPTGLMTITNSTIANNSSTAFGGGIGKGGGTLNLRNTIVSGNTAPSFPDMFGSPNVNENNLIGGSAGLQPLGNNGGVTPTHALSPDSPAINAGNNCVLDLSCSSANAPAALTTDQRGAGFPRKFGSSVDIGAFEFQLALGAYPDTNTASGSNTTVTPSAAPTNVTSLYASANKNFKGTFAADPATGVIRITNAYPAGIYTVTVKAFGSNGTQTTTFNLTVNGGTSCVGTASFTSASNIGTSNASYAAAVADFNNDGKQDVAIADSQNLVAIRLGNGNGTFTNKPDVTIAGSPIAVIAIAVGDFNGDGNMDFATANNQGGSISVRLGDGAGGFTSAPDLSFSDSPLSIATGDFNGDGITDIVATKVSSPVAAIFLGNGLGGFTLSSQVTVSFYPESIVVGDFNSDGKLDIATANRFGSNVSIRLGDGNGNLSGSTNISVGTFPRSIAVGDFNSDGKLDLVTANNATSNYSILIGDGAGGFTAQAPVAVGSQPRGVAVGDFNADGKDDFVVTRSTGSASIQQGDGAGNFTALPDISTGTMPEGLAIGDFNGDGRQDFIFANYVVPSYSSVRLGGCLNNPPTAVSAGGPYTISEGDSLTLSGSAMDADGDTLTYSWDVNGDGTFGDATGQNPTLNWSQLNALGINDGPATINNVKVRVSDGVNPAVDSAATPLVVNNTPPTLTISGAASTIVGATYTLNLSASDPGNDTISSWTINWGDGSSPQVVSGNPSSVTHVYTSSNSFTITATATDEDGTYAAGNTVLVTATCTSNPVVTNTNDSGAGSLRQAIADVCPGGTITFDTAGVFANPQTISLSAQLEINKDLTINGSGNITISGNNAVRVVFVDPGVVVQLNNLTLSNGTGANGAGVFNQGTLTINNCTISGNSTPTLGGGIANTNTLTINSSTISGNSANNGGGIYHAGIILTINNSTISGNSATTNGGGIYIGATTNLSFVTVTNNRADSDGASGGAGGGFFNGGSGTNTIRNSLITGNFVGTGSTSDDCNGSFTWTGSNLVGSNGSDCGCGTGTGRTTNPNTVASTVGTLASNGGPTQTHAFVGGSPAINLVTNTTATPNCTFIGGGQATTDQRGSARPALNAGSCDAGAYEAADTAQTGGTLVVNTTSDTNDGVCSTLHCSLREAITAANADGIATTINFNIPGSAPHVITLGSHLPAISQAVTINGLSQPDISGGICPIGSPTNDDLAIQIDDPGNLFFALLVGSTGGGSSIRGLSFTRFGDSGAIQFHASGSATCNYIGVAADGTTSGGNEIGILTTSTSNVTIGGASGDGNVIANNAQQGIYVSGGTTNSLVRGNVIRNNGLDGIVTQGGTVTGVRFTENAIYANGEQGIDLNSNGVTPNDPNDADGGHNNLQNFPVITSATSGASTSVAGSLTTQAGTYTLEFFSNPACDQSGNGEGQVYLGRITNFVVATTGVAQPFSINTLPATTIGHVITATAISESDTATSDIGDTSEFSACFTITASQPPVVSGIDISPNPMTEGQSITLTATAMDPNNDPLTYSWDVNGDGTFGDATGQNPTLTWSQLNALGINDGPATINNVKVRVSDGVNPAVDSAATSLTVNNTAPTLTISGAATIVTDSPYKLNLSSSDPGNDTISSWAINWGDGSPVQTVSGNPSSVTHTYAVASNYTITATATDEDNTYAAGNTVSVNVTPACTTNPVVMNTNDSGAGSLRQAVLDACPGNTITFDTAGVFSTPQTITLTSGEIVIDKNLSLQGPGANALTISGNNSSRVFNVSGGVTVTLDHLTIADGKLNGGSINQGGGIFNSGTLTITNSTISGNSVSGGSIFNRGGGIYNSSTLTITNSTLSGNSSGSEGGGIYNLNGTVTITNSTLSNNMAHSIGSLNSLGGGINAFAFHGNSIVTITGSTLSGNSASGSSNTLNQGGGIYTGSSSGSSTVTITGSTISGNSASNSSAQGGGIYIFDSGFGSITVNARNTIIAGNSASSSGPDVIGAFNSQGHNLVGNTSGSSGFGATGDILNQDPKLGPLQNNGGQTQTLALLPNSPALNAGDDCVLDNTCSPALGFNLTTDQRGTGFPRSISTVDVGAVEANYTVTSTAGDGQTTLVNTAFATQLKATVKESGVVQAGIDVTFTAPTSGAGGTFQGGGTTATVSTDANGVATAPTLTANGVGGSYNVVASLNTSGLLSTTFSLVNSISTPSISADVNGTGTQDQACPEQPLTLHANTTGATSYQWYSNGNLISGATSQTYQATSAGTYTVLASANDYTTPQSFGYVVQDPTPPKPSVTAGGPTTFCQGGSVTLTANHSTGIQWYKDGMAIPGANNQSYDATTSGSYSAELNALGCHSTFSDSVTVTVNPIPSTPTINAGGPTTFPAGGSVTLSSSGAAGNQWYKDGSPIAGETNQTYLATTAGSYTVVVTTNGCSSAASALTVVMTCSSSATVTNTNDSGAGSLRQAIADACPGNTITFDTAGVFSTPQTITLTSGEIVINKNLSLQGPGANALTISGNNSSRVFNVSGGVTATLDHLTIANGKLSGGGINWGGGILNSGTLTITNSTLSNNMVSGDSASTNEGGGINNSGTLTITNSTLSNNTASGGDSEGGGIFNSGGMVSITSSTVSGNSASGDSISGGGGIFSSSGTVNTRNTIIAGNSAPINGPDVFGSFTSQGHNLIGKRNDSAGFTNGTNNDQVGTIAAPLDPLLGPLTNNGGPSLTHALLPNSPALNAGDDCVLDNTCAPALGFNLTTDQRGTGFNRTVGTHVDIGAFEANHSISATAGTPQTATINTQFTTQLQATVTESGNAQSGLSVTFTAPASGASGTFQASGTNIVTITTDANGVATAPAFTANSTAGSYNVTASLAGGTSASDFSLTNAKADQTILFGALPDKTFGDADFNVSATASSGLLVSFGATGQCTITGNTVHLTAAGSCTVRASQAGDSNYNAAADIDHSFNIAKATTTTTVTINDATYDGQPHGGTASVTGVGGLNQSLTITYTGRNTTTYNSTTAPTNAGDYTASATFAGDANYQSSTDSRDFQITKANQTITFNALANKTYGDADFMVGASASSGLAVSFSATGNCTVSGSTVHITGAGSCTVTASQSGNSNYNPAPNVDQTFQIAKASQTITFNALSDKTYGDADFTLNATASSGLVASFAANGQCTITGNTVHITAAGSCTVRASQVGDSNYDAAPDVDRSFNVAPASTTTTLASSLNPSELGQSVTFTATVSSTAGTPTGTIQFKDGSSNLDSAVMLNASGVATFTTSALSTGTHTITAVYGGDANFSASTGTLPGGQAVNANPGLSINDVSVTEGQAGTTQALFTVTLAQASNLTVKVDYATADGTATAGSDYQSTTGTLTFNPGELTKTISVLVNGDTANEADETFFVNLSNPQNSTVSDTQGQGTITNDDSPGVQLSASSYSVGESGGHATVTVTRTGDVSQAMTVEYTTSDQAGLTPCSVANSLASQRCDYAIAVGTLRFTAGDTSKTIFIPIVDDAYTEGSESFTITLSNPTGGSLSAPSSATITINDNDAANGSNPITGADFLIRQLYMDFLGREPEPAGLAGWLNILNNCGVSVQQPCDRVEVASDFFRSDEFQMRGFFIYRVYTSLGRTPHYAEFMPDFAKVSGFLTEAELEANKSAFLQEFMARAEFKAKYDPTLNNPTAYVDLLLQTVGLQNHPQRAAWINGLTNQTLTRGQVLRALIDSAELYTKYYNEAFVVEMYFGFLRRDPDILYQQWIQLLNQTNDYRTLVSGFLNANEYVLRFGP